MRKHWSSSVKWQPKKSMRTSSRSADRAAPPWPFVQTGTECTTCHLLIKWAFLTLHCEKTKSYSPIQSYDEPGSPHKDSSPYLNFFCQQQVILILLAEKHLEGDKVCYNWWMFCLGSPWARSWGWQWGKEMWCCLIQVWSPLFLSFSLFWKRPVHIWRAVFTEKKREGKSECINTTLTQCPG